MFVRVSGFGVSIDLPDELRHPLTNDRDVTLSVVRWLSPHPNAILRDSEQRPVCSPPFDINHCLWKFTTLPHRRKSCTGRLFTPQLRLFGADSITQRKNVDSVSYARYDLIQIQSIDKFMNCTLVDNDGSTILETVTLPFAM
jgi:hypothetical protein